MIKESILIPFLLFLSLSISSSSSSDTLTPSQSLAGDHTLISAGQKFELGFFSPTADKHYLGIWYFNLTTDKTVVWVANRQSPARNSSSVSLNLTITGQIVISEQGISVPVWSSNQSHATNPVLKLLDTGNLVVHDADDSNSENYLWQSFDYPTDTLLPAQKLGWDKTSGLDRYLTSWKTNTDPSPGDYTFRMDRVGDPEIYLLKGGAQKIYRTGPWVGQRFSGIPPMNLNPSFNFTFQDDPDESVYYEAEVADPTMRTRLWVDPSGVLRRYTWVADRWNQYWFGPKDQCDQYMACGAYGVCDASGLFVCGCPRGFGPRNGSEWAERDASSGCARNTSLDCATDGFVLLGEMKLPESESVVVDREKGLKECRETCKKDCNCTAYASWRVVNGVESGCLMWSVDLKDMRKYAGSGQNLYVRVDASNADVASDDSSKTKKVAICVSIGVVILLLATAAFFVWKRKHPLPSNSRAPHVSRLNTAAAMSRNQLPTDNYAEELDLPLYSFEEVLVATNYFSPQNKLGEGGFGLVYKGVLKQGEVVAIKRLSSDSGQGIEEFKNEVKVIAKLQHRNLVRLIGCCLEGEEKMLVYEYLPNRSLDTILFHKEKRSSLDWQTRFSIICGIARGLQYLHHDSRLRIIHRDLKSSNVLLDSDMNPKISDFGMARIFGGEETALKNTRRVVGTYGYMAPEYAMYGAFSVKSDVFSFGVLLLEIVTGKANTRFHSSQELNLLGYAWRMWNEGKGRELIDPSIGDSYSQKEVEKCIQIGLLCVQERAEERPNMLSVVVSLSSETAPLTQPKLPGFCLGSKTVTGETESSSSRYNDVFSANQLTVSVIDGR